MTFFILLTISKGGGTIYYNLTDPKPCLFDNALPINNEYITTFTIIYYIDKKIGENHEAIFLHYLIDKVFFKETDDYFNLNTICYSKGERLFPLGNSFFL